MSNQPRAAWAGALTLVLAVVLFSGAEPQAGNPPPLVRRDLIRSAAPTFPEIKRDLFSTIPFLPSNMSIVSRFPNTPAGETSPDGKPLPPPEAVVRYVGYIKYASGEKPVAIVLIDGEAWAVSEGVPIGNGWSAVRVTDKEIELLNPQGKKLVFLYQGEGL